jgi:hypothetical protein
MDSLLFQSLELYDLIRVEQTLVRECNKVIFVFPDLCNLMVNNSFESKTNYEFE